MYIKEDKHPGESHIPGYNWCGAGTNVQQRLANKDPGINKLDEACKSHDILYEYEENESDRYMADLSLARASARRILDPDVTSSEKDAAYKMLYTVMERTDLYPNYHVIYPNWDEKRFIEDPHTVIAERKAYELKSKVEEYINETKHYDSADWLTPLEYPQMAINIKTDRSEPENDSMNGAIDSLPIELHMPGYLFCGPGTNVKERIEAKESGINGLDNACRSHDVLYHFEKSASLRRDADLELAKSAIHRIFDPTASRAEKEDALAVARSMMIKLGYSTNKMRDVYTILLEMTEMPDFKVYFKYGVFNRIRNIIMISKLVANAILICPVDAKSTLDILMMEYTDAFKEYEKLRKEVYDDNEKDNTTEEMK